MNPHIGLILLTATHILTNVKTHTKYRSMKKKNIVQEHILHFSENLDFLEMELGCMQIDSPALR